MKKKFVLVLAACATIPMCFLLYSKLGADGKIGSIVEFRFGIGVGEVCPIWPINCNIIH